MDHPFTRERRTLVTTCIIDELGKEITFAGEGVFAGILLTFALWDNVNGICRGWIVCPARFETTGTKHLR